VCSYYFVPPLQRGCAGAVLSMDRVFFSILFLLMKIFDFGPLAFPASLLLRRRTRRTRKFSPSLQASASARSPRRKRVATVQGGFLRFPVLTSRKSRGKGLKPFASLNFVSSGGPFPSRSVAMTSPVLDRAGTQEGVAPVFSLSSSFHRPGSF